jgi:IclR family acetate operon transcriptional repressor
VKRAQSIDSAFNALTVFERVVQEQPVGVSELARLTSLDKSRVQRILLTLYAANWITPAPGYPRKWQVNMRPLNLLRRAGRLQLLERAVTEMARLRDELGETVFLSAPQEDHMTVLEAAVSDNPVRLEFNPGDSIPARSAAGISIMAALPEGLGGNPFDEDIDEELTSRFMDVHAKGYATADSEEFVSFATALLDENGYPFASLTVAIPVFRLTRARRAEVAGSLLAAAGRAQPASPISAAGTDLQRACARGPCARGPCARGRCAHAGQPVIGRPLTYGHLLDV